MKPGLIFLLSGTAILLLASALLADDGRASLDKSSLRDTSAAEPGSLVGVRPSFNLGEAPKFKHAPLKAVLFSTAVPGGLWANKDFVRPKVTCRNVDDSELNILCDPQTSGGLLISVPRAKTERLLGLLARSGVTGARVVGKVLAKGDGHIIVRK